MNLPALASQWQQLGAQIEQQLRALPDEAPLSPAEREVKPRAPIAEIEGLWRGPGDASCYLSFCVYGEFRPRYGEEPARIETDDVTIYTADGEVSVYDALPELFIADLEVEALRQGCGEDEGE